MKNTLVLPAHALRKPLRRAAFATAAALAPLCFSSAAQAQTAAPLSKATPPAATLTLTHAETIMRENGVTSVQAAFLRGLPILSAQADGHGFMATLLQCGSDGSCERILHEACVNGLAEGRVEALELANTLNESLRTPSAARAVAVGGEAGSAATVCMRYTIDMNGRDAYGMTAVHNWRTTLRDFMAAAEEVQAEKLSRSVLSSGGSAAAASAARTAPPPATQR